MSWRRWRRSPDAFRSGHGVYVNDVDFAQIVKTYEHDESQYPNRKYSAPEFVSVEKLAVTGHPDMDRVSTSYIERLNATTRLHTRRFTRCYNLHIVPRLAESRLRHPVCTTLLSGSPTWKTTAHASPARACFGKATSVPNFLSSRSMSQGPAKKPVVIADR